MIPVKVSEFERYIVDKLLEGLRELPGAQVSGPRFEMETPGKQRIDAQIELQLGGKIYILLIEVKKSVFPRDAQQVIWQLNRYMSAEDAGIRKQVVPLLAAESISPGAKELLESESCGYFDSGGSLFIPAKGAYVYIEKPPPKTFQKSVRSLFSGKRSQVIHALLMRHKDWFGVKELAELAGVSGATVSETLTALERLEWLAVKGQGPSKERKLADPGALLDEWQKQTLAARPQTYRRFYVPSRDTDAIAQRLDKVCQRLDLDYALTEKSAAQIYAPYLTSVSRVTCRLLFDRHLDELYAELEARPVNEGANLDILETRSPGQLLFRERAGPVWIASPVQVYLDLLRSDGRGKEMAEHLRRERIGF
jgi:DNA-binding transcriptional ArsR family regulator